ncbi:MAG: riboflavin kinase, partial [Planctomycetales bacterium]|nr:riboflavin kinase [Planctomycetales bacterium]
TGDAAWPAAVHIGPSPTFGDDVARVEVHLIGFAGELYGRPLVVDFLARLRDIQPFADVGQLQAQLHRDVAAARAIAGGDVPR